MAAKSAVYSLPPELFERIRLLRAGGQGGETIYAKLKAELDPYRITPKTLSNFFAQHADEFVQTTDARAHLGKIADLLARNNIDPDNIGEVKAVKVSTWQGLTKDADGEAQIHQLEGASIVLTPAWDEGPLWPVVQPAKPTVVRPAKVTTRKVATPDGYKVAVIVPDSQFGFRRDILTGALDPFHDEAALAVVLDVIRLVRPDLVVFLGDFLDLAEFSRFEQEPEFANTTQHELDAAHLFLARVRAEVPDAEIRYLEGNHDRRLVKSIIANAKVATRLRPASTTPETWPVLSVPSLLRLDDLGITYLGGYPANISYLNDNVACIHGEKVRSSGSTAAAVIDDERVSTIFGHVHRIELQHKTVRVRGGMKTRFAASLGCTCRIDGAVPSTKGSTDPLGRAIERPENWQHGVGVVTYQEGDGPFGLEIVPIHAGRAFFRGMPIGGGDV